MDFYFSIEDVEAKQITLNKKEEEARKNVQDRIEKSDGNNFILTDHEKSGLRQSKKALYA